MKATTTAARYSANTSAASIDSAATIIQPDVAAAQADGDLRHEREQDRNRGDGPYRASPMRPSGKLRGEPDGKAG
jgi:hypothetical protein